MTDRNHLDKDGNPMACPDCGSTTWRESIDEDAMSINDEHFFEPTVVNFDIPVIHCCCCEFACTDHRAELIRYAMQVSFDRDRQETSYSIVAD